MTLEEKLEHSLVKSETRVLLAESVRHVLRKSGWPEKEIREAADLLMEKIYSVPAVDSGISRKGLKE